MSPASSQVQLLSWVPEDFLYQLVSPLTTSSKKNARLSCNTLKTIINSLIRSFDFCPDDILQHRIPKAFPQLQRLRFFFGSDRGDNLAELEKQVVQILNEGVQLWRQLKHIEVPGLEHEVIGFLEAVQRFSQLQSLIIPRMDLTHEAGQLLSSLTNLSCLNLSASIPHAGTHHHIAPALQALTKLTHLNLSVDALDDSVLSQFSNLRNLHELLISDTDITGSSLTSLVGLTHLTRLVMDGLQNLKLTGVSALAALTTLRDLSLTSHAMSELQEDSQLVALTALQSLTRFRSDFWHIENESVALLSLPALQEIFVSGATLDSHAQGAGCGITRATFCNLSFPGRDTMRLLPLPKLCALRVDRGLSLVHLQDICAQRQLTSLSLGCWGRLAAQRWAQLLAALPGLQHMEVGAALELGDDALQQMAAALPRLQRLWLSYWPRVTGAGLQVLQRCSQLRSLTLQLLDVPVAELAALVGGLRGLSYVAFRAVRCCDEAGHGALAECVQAGQQRRWRQQQGLPQQQQEQQQQEEEEQQLLQQVEARRQQAKLVLQLRARLQQAQQQMQQHSQELQQVLQQHAAAVQQMRDLYHQLDSLQDEVILAHRCVQQAMQRLLDLYRVQPQPPQQQQQQQQQQKEEVQQAQQQLQQLKQQLQQLTQQLQQLKQQLAQEQELLQARQQLLEQAQQRLQQATERVQQLQTQLQQAQQEQLVQQQQQQQQQQPHHQQQLLPEDFELHIVVQSEDRHDSRWCDMYEGIIPTQFTGSEPNLEHIMEVIVGAAGQEEEEGEGDGGGGADSDSDGEWFEGGSSSDDDDEGDDEDDDDEEEGGQ